MGDIPGSREPNPQAVSALTGFDPDRVADLRYRKRLADEQWRGHLKDVELRRGPYAGD